MDAEIGRSQWTFGKNRSTAHRGNHVTATVFHRPRTPPHAEKRRTRRQVSWLAGRCNARPAFPVSQWHDRPHARRLQLRRQPRTRHAPRAAPGSLFIRANAVRPNTDTFRLRPYVPGCQSIRYSMAPIKERRQPRIRGAAARLPVRCSRRTGTFVTSTRGGSRRPMAPSLLATQKSEVGMPSSRGATGSSAKRIGFRRTRMRPRSGRGKWPGNRFHAASRNALRDFHTIASQTGVRTAHTPRSAVVTHALAGLLARGSGPVFPPSQSFNPKDQWQEWKSARRSQLRGQRRNRTGFPFHPQTSGEPSRR